MGGSKAVGSTNLGRWPANVIHDGSEEVVKAFPAEAGAFAPVRGDEPSNITNHVYGKRNRPGGTFHADSGSAARFFYEVRRDDECTPRHARDMPVSAELGGVDCEPRRFHYSSKADADDRLGSKHPTVKPVDLMAYLCRLVTPPGGTVLDPFAGSGTTGMACMREGFNAILIEREAEYVADIKRRLAHVKGEDAPLFAHEGAP